VKRDHGDGLGSVDRESAANRDDAVMVSLLEEGDARFDRCYRRIRHRVCKYSAGHTGPGKQVYSLGHSSAAVEKGVGYDQRPGEA
jgi:hypothetical protein